MEVMDGTLTSLAKSSAFQSKYDKAKLAEAVLGHVLRALEYIASKGFIHRDVKPDNIFYVSELKNGTYTYKFLIGDFGVSNHASKAKTLAGSEFYMAPEIHACGQEQTPKADIWSLAVTILWTLDTNDFRHASRAITTYEEVLGAVASALEVNDRGMDLIRTMAEVDPEQRASATNILAEIDAYSRIPQPMRSQPALDDLTSGPEHGARLAIYPRKNAGVAIQHRDNKERDWRQEGRRQREGILPPLSLRHCKRRQGRQQHPGGECQEPRWQRRQRRLNTSSTTLQPHCMPGAFPPVEAA